MNRIQSKYHKTRTYKINDIFLSCFGDTITSKTMDAMN